MFHTEFCFYIKNDFGKLASHPKTADGRTLSLIQPGEKVENKISVKTSEDVKWKKSLCKLLIIQSVLLILGQAVDKIQNVKPAERTQSVASK